MTDTSVFSIMFWNIWQAFISSIKRHPRLLRPVKEVYFDRLQEADSIYHIRYQICYVESYITAKQASYIQNNSVWNFTITDKIWGFVIHSYFNNTTTDVSPTSLGFRSRCSIFVEKSRKFEKHLSLCNAKGILIYFSILYVVPLISRIFLVSYEYEDHIVPWCTCSTFVVISW